MGNEIKFLEQPNTATWLITGVAGFIGSHLLETLLKLDQHVVGLDNFLSGSRQNLDEVMRQVTPEQWLNFTLIEGDIRSLEDCHRAVNRVDYILHHAACSSVKHSIEEPIVTHVNNVDGFFNILVASQAARVKRVVYATSSAIYGNPSSGQDGKCTDAQLQSPYAVSKLVNEIYADVFFRIYGVESIGLRYFNIYGPRQDPNSDYAAVIPTWINAMIKGEPVYIYGDGETSRDFCYIDDVVQANLLAAFTVHASAVNQVYDVGAGKSINLNMLFHTMKQYFLEKERRFEHLKPHYQDFRLGDVRFSAADITKTQERLSYKPKYDLAQGLSETIDWCMYALEQARHMDELVES